MSAPDGVLPVAAAGASPGVADGGPPGAAPVRLASAPITLYDVAREAGVSIATVSRVVHGQDRVRPTTRDNVLRVIGELGYVPDGAAQSLARSRKNVIGLVCVEHAGLTPRQYDIERTSLLFYDEVLRGVESRIRDLDWSLLITYLREDADHLNRLLSLSAKVDGLLIGEGIVPSPVLARIGARVPVVVVAGDPDERAADMVTADNQGGAAALVRHLVAEHGRRRLCYVGGPDTAPDTRQRLLGLEQVLREHPASRLTGTLTGRFSVESGEEAGAAILAAAARDAGAALPDAVVCANDQMAIGVVTALRRAGVAVPEQVAVVGFDDIFVGSLIDPALTTVHQPMRLLGERGCARLLERIAEPGLAPAVDLLATELVLRRSCGCPPGQDQRRATTEPAGQATTKPAITEPATGLAPAQEARR